MREQLSMLLLRSATRANFCIRKISSLVQRDDDTAPTEPRPYLAWMRCISLAAWAIATSQETSRHGWSIELRISGVFTRSGCR